MSGQPEKPERLSNRRRWRYRCYGKDETRVRSMSPYELREAWIQTGLWFAAFVILLSAALLVASALRHWPPGLSSMAILVPMGLASLSFWTSFAYYRCAANQKVLVYDFDDGEVTDSILKQSKAMQKATKHGMPCKLEVWLPSRLVRPKRTKPLLRWLKWIAPDRVPIVRYAAPEPSFMAENRMVIEDRIELMAKLARMTPNVVWTIVSTTILVTIARWYGQTHAVLWPAVWDVGTIALYCFVLLSLVRQTYRIALLVLDLTFGRLGSNLSKTRIWLRFSRTPWIEQGQPAEWRTKARLHELPPALARNVTKQL